jgi:MoxR-like ATPase
MRDRLLTLHQRLSSTVLGSEEASYFLVVALLANGHVLLQGAPGIGKTSLAHALAESLDGTCRRIQFTPDLLPSDLLGYSLWQPQRGEFVFVPGPVFANIVVADEINRASPRLQSALLECMNEHQVTLDGITRELPPPFLVLATQNDLYSAGTFPLPEPQLDRFLLSYRLETPSLGLLEQIVAQHAARPGGAHGGAILTAAEVAQLQQVVQRMPCASAVSSYIAGLIHGASTHDSLRGTLSPRTAIALLRAAQAIAWLEGHPAVYPDDVKRAAHPVLQHRLSGRDSADPSGVAAKQWIDHILRSVPVP